MWRAAAQGVRLDRDRLQGKRLLSDGQPVGIPGELGVRRIIGPCAAGSLQPDVHPGDFVLCDQLVDRTWGRGDTFFDGGVVGHVGFADPYCPDLRAALGDAAAGLGITVHRSGTVVVVQGPRFSTRAASQWYRSAGVDVINVTQYPEALLPCGP